MSLWAPADLIIDDPIGLPVVELASLANAKFPIPQEIEHTSTGEIEVKVVPVNKDAQYQGDDEDSEYHITLRYIRLS